MVVFLFCVEHAVPSSSDKKIKCLAIFPIVTTFWHTKTKLIHILAIKNFLDGNFCLLNCYQFTQNKVDCYIARL